MEGKENFERVMSLSCAPLGVFVTQQYYLPIISMKKILAKYKQS